MNYSYFRGFFIILILSLILAAPATGAEVWNYSNSVTMAINNPNPAPATGNVYKVKWFTQTTGGKVDAKGITTALKKTFTLVKGDSFYLGAQILLYDKGAGTGGADKLLSSSTIAWSKNAGSSGGQPFGVMFIDIKMPVMLRMVP